MISNKLKRIFASNGVQVLLCVFMLLFVFDVAYALPPQKGGEQTQEGRGDGNKDEGKDSETVQQQLGIPNVEATTTTNSVTLTWTAIKNATIYEVTFNDETTTVTNPTFTASDLTASTDYSYSVVAKGDGESYTDSEPATGTATTKDGNDPGKGDKKYVLLVIVFIVVAAVKIVPRITKFIIKKPKRPRIKYCQVCRAPLDSNGKCTNPNCPSNIPKCKICSYELYENGECSNPNCPGKSRICEFCNKIITEAHKQDQLCPSNWINPIELDKDKIWIKREPNAQGGQGHIHPVWVKDSPIEWLYKNFASDKIFELESQTLRDLNKEGIDFVPEFYRKHEKGFIMSKADGDNLNNVFGLKGTKESKQIEKVKIIRFIKKLCDAIEKLHLKGISHRDLKPVNIFYDLGKEKITIIDFGSVAKKEKGNSNSKAPFGDDYKCGKDEGVDFESGKQRDIYAVGIIIKEIWEKCLLEDKQEIYDILYKTTCDNQKERVNITELINLIESKWGALK